MFSNLVRECLQLVMRLMKIPRKQIFSCVVPFSVVNTPAMGCAGSKQERGFNDDERELESADGGDEPGMVWTLISCCCQLGHS